MRAWLFRRGWGAALVVGNLAWANVVSATISIETVPVGNLNNAPDPATGDLYGRVAYAYNIGKYEVTAGQYTAFLNAVAKTDTYSLYNPAMAQHDLGSGITRNGTAGYYSYSVDSEFVNRPVNYVCFWDACRFANWLNNGQPTGLQGPGTTETGAYTLTPQGMAANTITRNTGATWAVTSEDEWYKAAYYNPSTSSYYLYPTQSNTPPGNNLDDPRPGNSNANYYTSSGAYPIDGTHYTTRVGEFQNSTSPYNTFDQGGNVWEWNEAIIGGSFRGIRGGSFAYNPYDGLQSNARDGYASWPTYENVSDYGFRVTQVPEPGSLAILTLSAVGILVRRKGEKR